MQPWKCKDYLLNGFSLRTIVLVRVHDQQIEGNAISMAFDTSFTSTVSIHIYILLIYLFFDKYIYSIYIGRYIRSVGWQSLKKNNTNIANQTMGKSVLPL